MLVSGTNHMFLLKNVSFLLAAGSRALLLAKTTLLAADAAYL